MTIASVLRTPAERRLRRSVRKGTWLYLVIYSGSITMPPSGMPHWSNTSERSTYRVPNLEWISVKSSPHFVVVWSAERKRECSILWSCSY